MMFLFPRWLGRSTLRPNARRPRQFRPRLEQLEERTVPSVYTVSSLADTNTAGTLRYAIDQADLNHTGMAASPDQIKFTVAGTINITGTPLPALSDIAVIDGTSATGYSGVPVITLDGTSAGSAANGLTITAGSSTVKGLDIINFSGNGIELDTNGSNIIFNNWIGITTAGSAAANQGNGVYVHGSANNTIGGTAANAFNVVSGNGNDGILLDGGASGNQIIANFIGTGASGVIAVGNGLDGIQLNSTGGNNLLSTNVISGNTANGVHITGSATGTQVAGDIIGLDTTGSAPLPNGGSGILIDSTAHDNLIGGTQASGIRQNIISANAANGIAVLGNAANTQIFHSFIGTDILGTTALGNSGEGVLVGSNALNTAIGGVGSFDQDLISGNQGDGIRVLSPSQGTAVINDLIGTDRTGHAALPNQGNGVTIFSSNNQFGGTTAGTGNVIAFNSLDGVVVDRGTSDSLHGNSIFGNTSGGVVLAEGGNNTQPAPVLTSAVASGAGTVQINGSLTAAASTTYTVELFASSSSTPSGQGQHFLGSVTVQTDLQGAATFHFTTPLQAIAGTTFTATATSSSNDTSVFSNAVVDTIVTPPPPSSAAADPSSSQPVDVFMSAFANYQALFAEFLAIEQMIQSLFSSGAFGFLFMA
jgi:titin